MLLRTWLHAKSLKDDKSVKHNSTQIDFNFKCTSYGGTTVSWTNKCTRALVTLKMSGTSSIKHRNISRTFLHRQKAAEVCRLLLLQRAEAALYPTVVNDATNSLATKAGVALPLCFVSDANRFLLNGCLQHFLAG